jgi:hypothetical protein
MTAGRVLVTPRSLTEAGLETVPELAPVRERGYELVGAAPGRMPTEDQLLKVVPGCVGWLAGVERISERVLARATGLRVISRNGPGPTRSTWPPPHVPASGSSGPWVPTPRAWPNWPSRSALGHASK